MTTTRSYSTVVTTGARNRVMVPVPFDPDAVWGSKPDHRVHGTVNGMNIRASIEPLDDGFGIVLGAAWRRDCGLAPGDAVDVVLTPEGPQRRISLRMCARRSPLSLRQERSSTGWRSSTVAHTSVGSTRRSADPTSANDESPR